MKKPKKLLALLLTSVLALGTVACSTNDEITPESTPQPTQEAQQTTEPAKTEETKEDNNTSTDGSNQIIIGDTTELDANFISGWTNTGVNNAVKFLIGTEQGYATTAFTKEGTFEVDKTVVKDYESVVHDDGSKTYSFTINANLTWNDGTPITAKDYVFRALLESSPEFKELDATVSGGESLIGYEEFNSGETKTFAGIHLIDEYTFSITIKAEELPDFFDLELAQLSPYPMFVIAPGVDISDDGQGATLSDEFTTDLIRESIMNEKTGYRFNPKITCGPYNFEGYDVSNKSATLVKNDLYAGTYDGVTPSIDKLIFKYVVDATQLVELETGTIDLLVQVADGDKIEEGLDLVDAGKANYSEYPRAGYGKIAFHCDFSPTQFQSVRQAIAWCLDRDEFCRQFTSGYGIVVNGYYGASLWEYLENKQELDDRLVNYTYNLDKAKELLIEDGWVLDENGGDYVEDSGNIRYKDVDGELMPLVIEWASSADNPVSTLISTMLISEVEKIGMQINQNIMDFPTLLKNYNRTGVDAVYSMYNLATGFAETSPVWYYYSRNPDYMGMYNANFILDEELENIALDMKATDPEDKEGWADKWVEFQVRWNELLPDVPLYSNQYHDFFSTKLENYEPNSMWQVKYAIIRANVK